MYKIIGTLAILFFLTSCSNSTYPINKIPPKKTAVLKETTKDKEDYSLNASKDLIKYLYYDNTYDEYFYDYGQIRNKREFEDICFSYYGTYVDRLDEYRLKCPSRKYREQLRKYVCYKNVIFSHKEFEKIKSACRRFNEEKHLLNF